MTNRPLTRDDFADQEAWLRHLHESAFDRESVGHINVGQFKQAYRAVALANCLGKIMCTSMDVTWSLQGLDGEVAVAAHRTLLFELKAWLARQACPPLYLWVLEHGARYGLHSHLMLHLPARLHEPFRTFLEATLPKIVGGPLVTSEVRTTLHVEPRADETTARQWGRFRYMLKGIDPHAGLHGRDTAAGESSFAEFAGLKYSFEGNIDAVRVGASPLLDEDAWARWSTLLPLPDISFTVAEPLRYNDQFLHWHAVHGDLVRAAEVAEGA